MVKLLAASFETMMREAGSLKFVLSIASRTHGAKMKDASPLKFVWDPATCGGVAMVCTSSLLKHPIMSVKVGVNMLTWPRRDLLWTMTTDAMHPAPERQPLLIGMKRVPPKFLKLWRMFTLFFPSRGDCCHWLEL